MGDDLGGQDGPLFSPDALPQVLQAPGGPADRIVRQRSRAQVYFHCCGAIREYIPDLIEIGVDALNPVQVQASGMDSAATEEGFRKGGELLGGRGRPEPVMSLGTPEEVRREVKRRIDDLAPGGGFELASVHNIQSDVRPENVVAFFDAALEFGKY